MEIQNIVVYAIVGLAAAFAVKTVIRQFTADDGACPKCRHCGPDREQAPPQPEPLIQIENEGEGI